MSRFNFSDLPLDHSSVNFYSVIDNDIALLCTKCEYRNTIYLLLGVPFCDHSSTTCSRRHNKVNCCDYLHKQPIQLSLF